MYDIQQKWKTENKLTWNPKNEKNNKYELYEISQMKKKKKFIVVVWIKNRQGFLQYGQNSSFNWIELYDGEKAW